MGESRIDRSSRPAKIHSAGFDQEFDMTLSTNKRNKNRTVYGRAFGVLVVLFASLGLQPCAVAAVSDTDCPHCPVEQMQAMVAASEHCDPLAGSSSSSGPSDCYEVEESAVDGRLGKFDFKDDGKFPVAIPPSEPFDAIRFDASSRNAVGPPDQAVRARPVPLHILYCVYRD